MQIKRKEFSISNYKFDSKPLFDYEASCGLIWLFFCSELSTVMLSFPPLTQKEWLEQQLLPSETAVYSFLNEILWSRQKKVHIISEFNSRADGRNPDTGDLKPEPGHTAYKQQLEIANRLTQLRREYPIFHYLVKNTSSFHKIVAFNALKGLFKISHHHSLDQAIGTVIRNNASLKDD